jgi:uncharacterized protein (TIGR03000 family)
MFRSSIRLSTRSVSWLAVAIAVLAASAARAQSPSELPISGAYTPRASTRSVYEFRYNFYMPEPWMYPGYTYPYVHGGPNPSFQIQRYATPTAEQPYPPEYLTTAVAPPPLLEDTVDLRTSYGIIHVFVPVADAVVYLNGQEVPGSGTHRRIRTPLLSLDNSYRYYATATYDKDGQKQTEYRQLVVGAGEYTVADFTRPALIVHSAPRLPAGPVDVNWISQTTTPLRSTWSPRWSPEY